MKQEIARLLKKADLKYTKQREGILAIMLASKQQLRAEDIYFALKQEEKEFSLSTIYRTLTSLAAAGIIEKTDLPNQNGQFFNLKANEHRHQLICLHCKATIPLDECPVERYLTQIGTKNGFQVISHSLEIFGICPHCQRKQ